MPVAKAGGLGANMAARLSWRLSSHRSRPRPSANKPPTSRQPNSQAVARTGVWPRPKRRHSGCNVAFKPSPACQTHEPGTGSALGKRGPARASTRSGSDRSRPWCRHDPNHFQSHSAQADPGTGACGAQIILRAHIITDRQAVQAAILGLAWPGFSWATLPACQERASSEAAEGAEVRLERSGKKDWQAACASMPFLTGERPASGQAVVLHEPGLPRCQPTEGASGRATRAAANLSGKADSEGIPHPRPLRLWWTMALPSKAHHVRT